MRGLVCLDANISSWVFRDARHEVEENHKHKFDQANLLMQKLEQAGYKLIIPQIVLSEIACVYTESRQKAFFKHIQDSNLLYCDFTGSTARILSRLLQYQYANKEYSKAEIAKKKMKYDIQILACAIDAGASCFYTEDSDFDVYKTKGLINICSLDDLPPDYESGTLWAQAQ